MEQKDPLHGGRKHVPCCWGCRRAQAEPAGRTPDSVACGHHPWWTHALAPTPPHPDTLPCSAAHRSTCVVALCLARLFGCPPWERGRRRCTHTVQEKLSKTQKQGENSAVQPYKIMLAC